MKSLKIVSFLVLFILVFEAHAQEIAITFDDAPTGDGPLYSGVERTEKILSHLKDGSVNEAAFFIITRNVDGAGKQRLLKYAEAGHLLANHTHTHESMREIGLTRYIRNIGVADSILRTLPGYVPLFRFPFLDEGRTRPSRDSITHALADLKLRNGYVTVDNYDWYLNHLLKQAVANHQKADMAKLKNVYIDHIWNSVRFYDEIGRKHLGRSPRHVLLLHENDLAALFVGDLIAHIKSQGWKIISVTDAYKDPVASTIPDVLFNGQGRIAALANSKGVHPRELVQDSEDEIFLEELVKKLEVFK